MTPTTTSRAARAARRPVYRLVRPRTILYAALIVVVGAIMLYQLTHRNHMGLSVLHVRAPMYTLARGDVRNGYTLRFANKLSEPHKFALDVSGVKDATVKSEEADVGARRPARRQRRSRRDAGDPALRDDAAIVVERLRGIDHDDGDRPRQRRDGDGIRPLLRALTPRAARSRSEDEERYFGDRPRHICAGSNSASRGPAAPC